MKANQKLILVGAIALIIGAIAGWMYADKLVKAKTGAALADLKKAPDYKPAAPTPATAG